MGRGGWRFGSEGAGRRGRGADDVVAAARLPAIVPSSRCRDDHHLRPAPCALSPPRAPTSHTAQSAMTFFVRKRLALGPIFFADVQRFNAPSLPPAKSISSTPFWSSLKRHLGFLALMAAGVVFVLLGLAVVARKGAAGWVEIILGLAMIATPIALTARERQAIREQEEKERAEREAVEKRNRELLAAYTAALDRVRRERTPDALQALAREREALPLPDDFVSPAAGRTALLTGFDELSKRDPAEVARIVDDVARAAGLTADDAKAIKADIYRTVLWHLLADDR